MRHASRLQSSGRVLSLASFSGAFHMVDHPDCVQNCYKFFLSVLLLVISM